jgi:ACR3 family arsenite transporter
MSIESKRMNIFERYLSVWVGICMVAGVLLGRAMPELTGILSKMEFVGGSQVNVPIAVLIWLMIFPMMLKIDFTSILQVGKRPRGLLITLFVNWMVKPFSMALLGWLFFRFSYGATLPTVIRPTL